MSKQTNTIFKSFFEMGVYIYNKRGEPLPLFAKRMLQTAFKGRVENLTKHLINKQMRENRCVGYQYN